MNELPSCIYDVAMHVACMWELPPYIGGGMIQELYILELEKINSEHIECNLSKLMRKMRGCDVVLFSLLRVKFLLRCDGECGS